MSNLINRIKAAQVKEAEDRVIAGIPADLLARMKKANEEYAAKGGCTGCASKRIGVHYMPCSAYNDCLY